MAAFGKLSNSFVSLINENTLALANIKVDFSLIRCDPSKEYAAIGSALSESRREEAETGAMHATACKLGFLFHEMLPETPNLIKAYGTRASSILSRPDISPEGTDKDGPFRAFVGADCTSIWASATCGSESISVHLLACMLSRAWDAKAATSIWVEIVEERRRQVKAQMQGNRILHPQSVAAASESMGRAELAKWDASARSWLRRADLFMARDHTQFRLVVDNLAIPYSSTGSTFEKVTMAWVRSMEVLERLLGNLPQQACDRGVLLSISSWHLYPDLLVFQREAKRIQFKDTLFPSAGVLSLGLEYKGPTDNVTQWSLALSHLRYYGDPVRVHSRVDLSRIRIDQIWLVVLGVLFRQWNVPYANFDIAVNWFRDLHVVLRGQDAEKSVPQLSWILKLCAAAAAVDEPEDGSLIRYGWRRGIKLLGAGDSAMLSPFFGLSNTHVKAALSANTETDCGIAYLRGIASELGLDSHEAVISYTGSLNQDSFYTEWTTVAPIEVQLSGWAGDTFNCGSQGMASKKHARWVCIHDGERSAASLDAFERRRLEIQNDGEVCHAADDTLMPRNVNSEFESYHWDNPPLVFECSGVTEFWSLKSLRGRGVAAFTLHVVSEQKRKRWHSLFEDAKRAAETTESLQQSKDDILLHVPPRRIIQYLKEYLNAKKQVQTKPSTRYHPHGRPKRKAPMDEATHAGVTVNGVLVPGSTSDINYFAADVTLTGPPYDQSGDYNDTTGAFYLMTGACHRSTQWLIPLRVLEVAQKLYEQLPGASISLRIVEQDLLKSQWLPPALRSMLDNSSSLDSFTDAAEISDTTLLRSMSRASSFACIAMFESGRFNVDPDQLNEVIALCSEDSIFVAGALLNDPGVFTHGTLIRHLVGNIGHHGMVFMVSPLEPRIRHVAHNPQLVEHRPYDGVHMNSFLGTSMHLSFTTWKMPLDWHSTGEIDQEMFLLESVVAVQDNGTWVADIDVLEMEKGRPDIIENFSCDPDCAQAVEYNCDNVVSVDTWEELLDPPPCTAVLRAKDNWVARLAVVTVLAQQGRDNSAVIIGDKMICWSCLKKVYAEPELHIPELIIF